MCVYLFSNMLFWIFHVINVFIFHKMYTLSKSSTTIYYTCVTHQVNVNFKLGLLYVYLFTEVIIYIFF